MDLPVIVVGGGGHAKVLVSTLLLQHRRVLGFVDPKPLLAPLLGNPYLGADDAVFLHSPDQVVLVNGVGSTGSTHLRRAIYEKFTEKRYTFATVIHPSAIIAPEVDIAHGVQVMAGVVVQPGSRLGANVIINTGARVDHDCSIDPHAHIAPGVTLSGNVHVGEGAHIGTGASIIHGITIGAASVVGAGAVVVENVPADYRLRCSGPNCARPKLTRGPQNRMKNNPVYVVHCIDTEGPLHESVEVTFERLRAIFHLELEPSLDLLHRLQLGKVDLGGREAAVQKVVDPHLLAYNDSWDKVDAMLAELMQEAFRTRVRDSAGGGWIYNWFCVDHVDYDVNPRHRDIGYHNIFEHYRRLIRETGSSQDGLHFHYHPHSFRREAHRCATHWWSSSNSLHRYYRAG